MKQFWNYAHTHPAVGNYPADTAFVLPRDYGYGFRSPTDRVWGKWEADSLSPMLWDEVNRLLKMHVLSLDIVYETRITANPISLPYNKLIYWNGTIIKK
jgi:hypothetical protein